MKRTALALATTALLTLAMGLVTGSPAAASATVIRETVTTSDSESGLTHDCHPGVTGVINGVGVTTTQSVETATGFHIHGTITGDGRIDWSDGTYTLIHSVDHFSFNAVGKGTTTFAETHVDSGDFYSPEGVFLFRNTFHEVEHFTATNGVVRVDFERVASTSSATAERPSVDRLASELAAALLRCSVPAPPGLNVLA